jgi:adenylosuccinate synthase
MNLVVVGAQWGDEGKGKIVDFLAERADLVVRYSGGANAGHTVVSGDSRGGERTYKLHLVPSGIVYPGKKVLLGTAMVIDPQALFSELEELETQGIDWRGRVFVSDRAHLVLPRYKELDIEADRSRRQPIGTTGRGIGVAYSLKSSRDGIRLADLLHPGTRDELREADRAFLEPFRERLEGMAVDIVTFMEEGRGRTLLEGAQGTMLDLDLGTYPYVSSGMSSSAGAPTGAGIGPRDIDGVLGVCKAYTSRVGNGPFPAEFRKDRDGDLEATVRDLGREYGVTTGRPRRCGYLDLVALRYACRTNSIGALAMTHLDVYDRMEEVRICTAYQAQGRRLDHFPASAALLEQVEPVFESLAGWQQPIGSCRRYGDLPPAARKYVEFVEKFTGTPITIVSVGYRREETIVRRDPWTPS